METELIIYVDEFIKELPNKDKVLFLKSFINHVESRIDAWEELIKDEDE